MYGNKIVIMNKVISLIMGIYKVFSTRRNKEMVMIILQTIHALNLDGLSLRRTRLDRSASHGVLSAGAVDGRSSSATIVFTGRRQLLSEGRTLAENRSFPVDDVD